MQSIKLLSWFRKIAFAEGVSYLVLLGIAMPLKYMADLPQAVRIVGSLHGALFVAFLILAFLVKEDRNKSFIWLLKAFLVSIIPFGTFVFDKELKAEQEKLQHA
jgi:integral membrane protein